MGLLDSLKALFSGGGKKAPKVPNMKDMQRIDVEKRFEMLGKTGQGSMSKVFRARDRKLGRVVCVKILDLAKTAKFEGRFSPVLKKPPEAIICMMMSHENIVKTFEYGISTKGEPILVMELIDGAGLNFLIETKSQQLNGLRISLLKQMGEGLAYIHKQKFLHRDICPRNFMVTSEGVLKYIDFGLAIPYTTEFCKPGNRTGTPDYLAPEIIKRAQTDHRVDMFALGVTAFELFTSQLPWEKSESMQTLLKHMNTPGGDPKEFRPDLDEATVKFLRKGIERDPNRRFQSAEEFRDAADALPRKHW